MEGHMLANPALKYNRDLHTPQWAEFFEGGCPNCLSIKKKTSFRGRMGILKSKISSWSVPSIIINYWIIIIINVKYNYYITKNGFLEESNK